jgi:hypothetical protein
MAVKQAGTSRLEVKLPERLHEALRQLAEKERRTITAQRTAPGRKMTVRL